MKKQRRKVVTVDLSRPGRNTPERRAAKAFFVRSTIKHLFTSRNAPR